MTTPTPIATFHSKRGFQDAVTRLLGPRPPCDQCRPDYPFDMVWLVLTGGHAYLRAAKDGFAMSVRIYNATATNEAVDEAIPLDVGNLFDVADAMPNPGAVITRESSTGKEDGFASVRFTGVFTGSLNVPMAIVGETDYAPTLPEIAKPMALFPGPMLRVLQCAREAMAPGKANLANKATHGVRLEFEKNTLRAVATDGHRLHIGTYVLTPAFPETSTMLLPRALVTALCQTLFFHTSGVVPPIFHVEYGPDYVSARVGEDTLRCERQHGLVFPPYNHYQALPGDRPFATVRSDAIVEYLTRVMSLRSAPYVGLLLSTDKLTCRTEVSTASPNDSFGLTLDDRFRVDYEGDTRRTKVHAEYLRDALNACGPRVVLTIGLDQHEPITVESQSCKVILMPAKYDPTDPEFAP